MVLYKLPSGWGINKVEDDNDDEGEEENLGFLTGQQEEKMESLDVLDRWPGRYRMLFGAAG